jgi:hypothetical protein
MSVQQPSTPAFRGDSAPATYDEGLGAGYGWVVFAGTMLMIVGVLNVVYGIAAIDNSSFFVNDAKYVISSLNTWGWVVLIIGVVQLLTAFGVWARNTFATWLGVAIASLSAIAQLLMISAYPLLSLALFAIDLAVVYGLAVHGGHAREA